MIPPLKTILDELGERTVKRKTLFMTILISMLIMTGCKGTDNAKDKIRIGTMPIVDLAQLYVATEMGYFSDVGLEIETVKMAGGPAIAPAVASGDLEIGWSNSVSIAAATEKGFDFVFIAPGAFNSSSVVREAGCIMLPPNSPVKVASDLEGKIIGVNTLGNISDLIVHAWADKTGVNLDGIKFSEIPYPDMEAALAAERVDAAVVWEPFVSQAIANNSAIAFDCKPMSYMGDQILIASWFSEKEWVESHPEQVKKFVEAIMMANEFISNNPDDARSITANYTNIDSSLAQNMSLPSFPSEWSLVDLQRVLDLSLEYGLLNTNLEASTIVDSRANASNK